MKYYVNKKTMMLGSDDKTYWVNLPEPPDWLPLSAAPRLESVLINRFRADLHTLEYDDQADTCLEIDTSGRNFVSTLEENSGTQEIINLFKELEAAEKELNDD